jgi:hypothetical protein
MKTPTLLVLPALFWVSSAVTLNDLFQVKTTSNGACNAAQQTILESWLTDTNTLVNTALAGLPNYNADESLRRNLATWFSIRVTRQNLMNQADRGKATTVQRE